MTFLTELKEVLANSNAALAGVFLRTHAKEIAALVAGLFVGAAAALHWPECWDTAAYPDLDSCIKELFICNTCRNGVA